MVQSRMALPVRKKRDKLSGFFRKRSCPPPPAALNQAPALAPTTPTPAQASPNQPPTSPVPSSPHTAAATSSPSDAVPTPTSSSVDVPVSLNPQITIPSGPTDDPPNHGSLDPSYSDDCSRELFERALLVLNVEDQKIINDHLLHGERDIGIAVDQVYAAVEAHKKQCHDQAWTFVSRGEAIVLRDQAGKVLSWLNKLKGIGDVVANIDPIHVGLPWAGIRLMLEFAVADKDQMAHLLQGTEVAFYMSNRLKAYLDYFATLPVSQAMAQARMNFSAALTGFYAFILQFFASAIRVYQQNTFARFCFALGRTTEDPAFKISCEEHERRTETEAAICERFLSWEDRRKGQRLYEDFRTAIDEIQDMHQMVGSMSRLHEKIDLQDLQPVKGAAFDSYAEEQSSMCLPGTRAELLKQIMTWSEEPQGRPIYWLKGMAGTGKSTIARTIADMLSKKHRLGASFFFKRGEADRSNASRLFPTLAYQLAAQIPRLGREVAKSLDQNRGVSNKVLREQFDKLLFDPLSMMPRDRSTQTIWVIVIDALDECESDHNVKMLIRLLAECKDAKALTVRIFTTSRPELPVRLGFQGISGGVHQDVVLEDITASTVDKDIRTFLTHEFANIRRERFTLSATDAWPGGENLDKLTAMASPLFIYAATVCRFVADTNWDPQEQLLLVLRQSKEVNSSQLSQTYSPVLERLLVGQSSGQVARIAHDFQRIVGTIISLFEPLSPLALSGLLADTLPNIRLRLDQLQSVLSMASDANTPVRLLHRSFRDFLVDDKQCRIDCFRMDASDVDKSVAARCIELLSKPGILKQDVCGTQASGIRRKAVPDETILMCLPAHVQYACRYWIGHLHIGRCRLHDQDDVLPFLRSKFLHWIEALSWLGQAYDAIGYIDALRSLVDPAHGPLTAAFLDDAKRFMLQYRQIIDVAPLQLYCSAIAFAPTSSVVRTVFRSQIRQQARLAFDLPFDWSSELLTLDGHEAPVVSVSFSPNGIHFASASEDRTVRMWNIATGRELAAFHHEGPVRTVAFSPRGDFLVSAASDGLRRWYLDMRDGLPKGKPSLNPHRDITDCGFTSNNTLHYTTYHSHLLKAEGQDPIPLCQKLSRFDVSSGGLMACYYDNAVTVRDYGTREEIYTLRALGVQDVAFSNDEFLLAVCADNRLKLWETGTGTAVRTKDDRSDIYSIAFSPDDTVLATGTGTGTILLRKLEVVLDLEQESSSKVESEIQALAFAPDGRSLATGYWHGTITLWDVRTGDSLESWQGHASGITSVSLASGKKVLASGTTDGTLILWDLSDGVKEVGTFEGDGNAVDAVDLSDTGSTLASAFSDRTVKVWDVELRSKIISFILPFSVRGLTLSPDGSLLAITLRHSLRVWNIQSKEQVAAWQVDDAISKTRFLDGGTYLAYDKGVFHLKSSSRSSDQSAITSGRARDLAKEAKVSEDNQWVRQGSQDVLWLPPEYRPRSAKFWASHERVVAIAKGSAVLFITVE